MKKISIMLLAALMLFAFVACEDNTGDDVADAATLQVTTLAKAYLGKTAADLGTIEIAADGKVTGSLKEVKDFKDFNTAVAEEQSGYYLGFSIKDASKYGDSAKLYFYKTDSSDKTTVSEFNLFGADGKSGTADDNVENIFRVAKADKTATAKSWKVVVLDKNGDSYSITFDLSGVTFGETK